MVSVAVPALVGAIGVNAAHADVVRSIVVQGNQRVDSDTVRNYVLIHPGKNFGSAEVDESVKALFATGLFSDVKINRRGNALVVTVKENAVVGSVRYEGNKKLKKDMLSAITETKPRSVLTEAKLQGDVERIKEYYGRTGRATADVQAITTPRDNGRVDITFKINEGERTGVKTITFEGNKAFSDGRLRNVIQTKQTNLLSWFSKRDIYDEAKLEADQELLRRFYLRNGYADFRIVSAEPTFDEVKHDYNIVITVDEGERYNFGNVNLDSTIPDVSADSVRNLVRTKSGKVFNSTLIEKTAEDITIELARSGHAFATVRPRGDRNYESRTVDVTYLIDEGPRVYVERIDVHGNDRTRDYVIRREFDLSEGDAYNRVLVDKAERRLRNLGYFKSVNVTTQPGSTPDRVVIDVNVEDQSTGSFQIGGGYSTDNGGGFIASVSMTEKNFLGRGQYLKIALSGGEKDRAFDLSFTEPYFLGQRIAAGFDAYVRNSSENSIRNYNMDSWGGTLRFGLPITDDLDIGFNYKIAERDVSTNQSGANALTLERLYGNGTWINSSVGWNMTYSTIDNRQDPRDGYFVRFQQDFAGVGGDGQFIRTQLDARAYKELLPESGIIGLVRAGAGNITGLGEDVQTLDNFFRGGETIRGFKSLGYGARYQGIDETFAMGGKNYWNATAEVQFPLALFPEDFGLRGAVFADAGSLWDVDLPEGLDPALLLDSSSVRSSVGASIIWNSPFGPLRADFAKVLSKTDFDQTQVFRFSAGAQF